MVNYWQEKNSAKHHQTGWQELKFPSVIQISQRFAAYVFSMLFEQGLIELLKWGIKQYKCAKFEGLTSFKMMHCLGGYKHLPVLIL